MPLSVRKFAYTSIMEKIRVSTVREKSRRKHLFKVMELSGNFEICQGILEFKHKSGKSQGILK